MNADIVPRIYSIIYLLAQPDGFQVVLLCLTPPPFHSKLESHDTVLELTLVELNSEICPLGLPKG